jgi:hypothetical protein
MNNESDRNDVRKLLRLASEPPVPADAAARLMARIAREPQAVAMRSRPPGARPGLVRYAAALPLAASLALGVYLGARGTLDFMLPSAITGGVAQVDDTPDELGGLGEADAYAGENLS